jgi:plastocyanin
MRTKNVFLSSAKNYFILITVVLLFSFLNGGCSEDESTSPPPPNDPNAVSIQNFSFSPGNRTVSAGTTITWTNNDNVAHTVTSSQGSQTVFDSGNIPPGGSFTFTFSQTGTFNYFCTLHPSMTAQVTVQ